MYKELRIVREYGKLAGIRDAGGYLLFLPKVSKYQGQQERYERDLSEQDDLANAIMNKLSQEFKNCGLETHEEEVKQVDVGFLWDIFNELEYHLSIVENEIPEGLPILEKLKELLQVEGEE